MRTLSDLGGSVRTLLEYTSFYDNWTAFNPSIAWSPKLGYQVLIRSANYTITDVTYQTMVHGHPFILNRTFLMDLSDDLETKSVHEVLVHHGEIGQQERGIEDGRIVWDEELEAWRAAVVLYGPPQFADATIAVYNIGPLVASYSHHYRSPMSGPEKNWMMPSRPTPAFDFIYGPYHTIKDGVLQPTLDKETHPHLKELHGGTQALLQGDGTYLAVVHEVGEITMPPNYSPKNFIPGAINRRAYTHFFARYDATGTLTHLSDPFVFENDDIEFAAGLVEHGTNMAISYGKNDQSARLAILPKETFLKELKPL